MYLNEKKIKLLQTKNILFICFGVFEAFFSGSYIVSEFVMYRDNLYTAWHAKSMASSILFFTVGSILLVHALISRHRIGQATFFSSYFEGSLDGYVECSELAEVLGTKVDTVRKQLQFAKKHYMQKFELIEREGETIAELYSKKTLCQCRSCGAPMEKRIYFTGTCPYCKSSDLFAKILTDQRFYSISSDVEKGNQDASFYLSGGRKIKKVLYILMSIFAAFLSMIGFLMVVTELPHYFDEEYQKKLLLSPDNHLRSYALIKADILDTVLYAAIMFAVLFPLVIFGLKRIFSLMTAKTCASIFTKCRRPFISAKSLPEIGMYSEDDQKIQKVRKAIHKGDLINCTLEVHQKELVVALAKKIVKDKCPSCSGPIVGAVDENYVCNYCGKQIMGVVEKG